MCKNDFLKELKAAGFVADYANNGIPTVFVKSADEFAATSDNVRAFMSEKNYTQSFGIGILRKTEAIPA